MTIPELQENGELPPGEHLATIDEIRKAYGSSSLQRKILMSGLLNAIRNFDEAGVKTIWLNGSFTTSKTTPNDIDGCWEFNQSVDIAKLDPVFLGATNEMKKKFGLDFFIANITEAGSNLPFPKFFQINREGNPKGIILVKLGEQE